MNGNGCDIEKDNNGKKVGRKKNIPKIMPKLQLKENEQNVDVKKSIGKKTSVPNPQKSDIRRNRNLQTKLPSKEEKNGSFEIKDHLLEHPVEEWKKLKEKKNEYSFRWSDSWKNLHASAGIKCVNF